MNTFRENASWESLMEFVDLIEVLEDPYGRKGYFSVRINKIDSYQSCHIEFNWKKTGTMYQIERVCGSYTQATKKENIQLAINQFILWYNEKTKPNDTIPSHPSRV